MYLLRSADKLYSWFEYKEDFTQDLFYCKAPEYSEQIKLGKIEFTTEAYDDTIVWANENGLFYCKINENCTEGQETQISDKRYIQASIYENTIVWNEEEDNIGSLYSCEIGKNCELEKGTLLLKEDKVIDLPVISKNKITWTKTVGEFDQIFMCELENCESTKKQLTNVNSYLSYVYHSNDIIAFSLDSDLSEKIKTDLYYIYLGEPIKDLKEETPIVKEDVDIVDIVIENINEEKIEDLILPEEKPKEETVVTPNEDIPKETTNEKTKTPTDTTTISEETTTKTAPETNQTKEEPKQQGCTPQLILLLGAISFGSLFLRD